MAPQPRGSRPRHVPQRTCVACRQVGGKRDLIRIVRTPVGSVAVDPTGKRTGRGAYVHDARECWTNALKGGVLSRALKADAIAEADLAALREFEERSSASSARE